MKQKQEKRYLQKRIEGIEDAISVHQSADVIVMELKGTFPKYEATQISCGKCGAILISNDSLKPKSCRECGEKVNWAYFRKPNPSIEALIARNRVLSRPHLTINTTINEVKGEPSMGYVLKLDFNRVELVEVKEIDLPFLREQIGCQWVEAIPCPYGYIVGDEEYCLHHPPARNLIASRLAQIKLNGICLLVDVKESDFVPFSKEEAEEIREKLLVSNDTKLNK